MNKISKALRKSASKKSNQENNRDEITTKSMDDSDNNKFDDKNNFDNKKYSDDKENRFEDSKKFQCNYGNENISLENLTKFCEYLEVISLNANDFLNKIYDKDDLRELRERLSKHVKELITLQREIKAISDSIDSLKMQIQAVKSNKKDHKRKLRQLKSKEYRTKATLNNENKIQNIPKPSQIPVPKVNKLSSSKNVTNRNRQYGETAILPWFDSLAITEYDNNNDNIRSNNNSKIEPQIMVPKRMKNNHQKRRLLLRAQPELQEDEEGQIEERGVTLYLTPVAPTQQNENDLNIFHNTSSTTCNTILNWQWPD